MSTIAIGHGHALIVILRCVVVNATSGCPGPGTADPGSTPWRELKQRVDACFHAGALASGVEMTTRQVGEDYTDMWTNTALAAAYQANLEGLGRAIATAPAVLVSGSTDMGNVSKLVPSIHPMIGIAPRRVALHTEEFARWAASPDGDRGVLDGAKARALTGVDILRSPALLAAMRAAFEADSGPGPAI